MTYCRSDVSAVHTDRVNNLWSFNISGLFCTIGLVIYPVGLSEKVATYCGSEALIIYGLLTFQGYFVQLA